ncbi:MAG: hypothetical protein WCJ19_02190 [bacterium]
MKFKYLYLALVLVFLLVVLVLLRFFLFASNKEDDKVYLNESQAIEVLKGRYPEFRSYPGNNLPPKSIKVEKADNGWYVAFILEGSGIPILDAKCFFVDNDSKSVYINYVKDDSNIAGDFSAKECKTVAKKIGGEKDKYGCLTAAGYSWCESKNACIRSWEEKCIVLDASCGVENCHGLDIQCGSNTNNMCTSMYQVGDICRQYAQCGLDNGSCQQIQNSNFTQCKTCVQNCLALNPSDSVKQIECEGKCNLVNKR